MNFLDLPETTQMTIDALRTFVEKHVISRSESNNNILTDHSRVFGPDGAYTDEVNRHRREIREASADAGFYHICVPAELGGGGEGAVTWFALWESVFRRLGPHYMTVIYDILGHWSTGPSHIFARATPALREAVLPALMSGEKTMCFAMSEPDAGTDIWNLSTQAVRDGSGWKISGTKQWISNGPYADYALVFAITDRKKVAERTGGISAFLVPTTAQGFEVTSIIRVFGHQGGHEGILSFDEVRAEPEWMIGNEGEGLAVGFEGLALGRLYNTAKAVGLSRWGLELAKVHSLERRTFGKPIFDHQAVSFMLAESAVEILGAHLLALHAANLVDEGSGGVLETSAAKMNALEMGCRVIDRVIQIHGGMGVTNEMGFVEAWHYMRVARIADGSDQILRRVIAGGVAKDRLKL